MYTTQRGREITKAKITKGLANKTRTELLDKQYTLKECLKHEDEWSQIEILLFKLEVIKLLLD